MVQQSLETPEDLFHFQLRSALTMENHSLEALEALHGAVHGAEVKELLSHHMDETRDQIENLEEVFTLCEYEKSTAPSPATTGIKNQADSLMERTDPSLHDQVALSSAMGNEHFEIASYQGLIVLTQALKIPDATTLLTDNLDQEVHTSEELHKMLKKISQ